MPSENLNVAWSPTLSPDSPSSPSSPRDVNEIYALYNSNGLDVDLEALSPRQSRYTFSSSRSNFSSSLTVYSSLTTSSSSPPHLLTSSPPPLLLLSSSCLLYSQVRRDCIRRRTRIQKIHFYKLRYIMLNLLFFLLFFLPFLCFRFSLPPTN